MYFKTLKPVIFFAAFFFATTNFCFAEVVELEEASAFASFIEDLVHSTNTPKRGVICFIGSDIVSKAIAGQDKTIIDLDKDPTKYTACKAIYIAQGKEKGLRSEMIKFNKNKILTIAVFDGFTESGGMIQVQMGRRNFELILNTKEIKEAGVRLNALITSLVIN